MCLSICVGRSAKNSPKNDDQNCNEHQNKDPEHDLKNVGEITKYTKRLYTYTTKKQKKNEWHSFVCILRLLHFEK